MGFWVETSICEKVVLLLLLLLLCIFIPFITNTICGHFTKRNLLIFFSYSSTHAQSRINPYDFRNQSNSSHTMNNSDILRYRNKCFMIPLHANAYNKINIVADINYSMYSIYLCSMIQLL